MNTIQTLQRTDEAGTLTLSLPLGQPDTEFEVLVVVQPNAASDARPLPPVNPWAGADAIRQRLAATNRDFGDGAQEIREDRDR